MQQHEEIYQLASTLLDVIRLADPVALSAFGIHAAIHEEILEVLENSNEPLAELTLAPVHMAFTPGKAGRVAVCVYPMEVQPPALRVECQLWCGQRATDLTLIADYLHEPRGGSLTFRLLEVQ